MKAFFLLCLIWLASFIHCSAKETIFKCTIKGYDKLDKSIFLDNSMSLEFYNALAINERASAHLTKKGTYTLKFNITYPQVVQIQSGNGYYTEALVSPGDTVVLLLTYKITDVRTQGYPSPHYSPDFKSGFLGKNARIQSSFFNFRDSLNVFSVSVLGDNDLSDVDVLNSMLSAVPKGVASFFECNRQFDPKLSRFAEHEVSYKLIQNAMGKLEQKGEISGFKKINFPEILYLSRPVAQCILTARGLPKEAFELIISRCYFDNPQFKITEEDQILIRKGWKEKLSANDSIRVSAIGGMFKTNPAAIDAADSIKFTMETEYYFENLPAGIAEFLTARRVCELKISSNANFYRKVGFERVKNLGMVDFLTSEFAQKVKGNSVSHAANKNSNIIKTLLKAFPGKSIYIDVWATWCSPCIGEFDFYPRLVEDFKNKVVFVMLCVDSKEQTHGNMIARLPFAADHYLLSDTQYTELKNDFGITGIPHYLFINKKGEVLNNYKRPSDYEALFDDIQKQL